MKIYVKYLTRETGNPFKVSQFCNDWFTVESDNIRIARRPFSVRDVLITKEDLDWLRKRDDTGIMFEVFEPYDAEHKAVTIDGKEYRFSFRRKPLSTDKDLTKRAARYKINL